ncbi:MAG: four helix bundle protein [Candidatus Omnitrophica bacterium]|nr:four helix bundle protein [Candidatus Omnitrophota bacterium]
MWNEKEKYVFDFEKLKVYEMGLDFVRAIFAVAKEFPRDYQYSVGDQLRRAALSIVNNIAEGSGKLSKKEKAQFYRIALNSARECIPMLTILSKDNIVPEADANGLRENCIHICNMLGKLISSVGI